MMLSHLRVNVIAGIAYFRNLLGQQLNTLSGIAENDCLVDLQLAE
jgi:hypothetical protein